MKILFAFVMFVSFLSSTFGAQIFDIWEAEAEGENTLVLTTDGIVHELLPSNAQLLQKLQVAKENASEVKLQFNSEMKSLSNSEANARDVITGVNFVQYEASDENFHNKEMDRVAPDPVSNYEVSIIPSMEDAKYYFETMKKNAREKSQCYNRAYVWAYELYRDYNIHSTKYWLFFTKKYIREFRYKWWFHVTPAVYVQEGGEVAVMTMDRKYMQGPTVLEQWKNFFIQNKAHCPQVTQYSSYRYNQNKAYCFLIESNMYFWQPFHIENLESRNWDLRMMWRSSELRVAYRDAFGIPFRQRLEPAQ